MASNFVVTNGSGDVAFGPDNENACSHWAARAMKSRGGAYFVIPASAAPRYVRVKGTKTRDELDAEIDEFTRGVSERAARERTTRNAARRARVRPGGKRDV